MATQTLRAIEKRIRRLEHGLAQIGNMRPGTLSVQYRNPAERKTPFHQISYTYKGKSHSEYVRPENVQRVRREIVAYRHVKTILNEWVDLSIQASRLRCAIRSPPRKALL